ncbi:MAG: hypothetical protein VXX55_08215, partial [Planctomycetota bacterium]|nr:hypothetical protein [Planctomycetota bacterium]
PSLGFVEKVLDQERGRLHTGILTRFLPFVEKTSRLDLDCRSRMFVAIAQNIQYERVRIIHEIWKLVLEIRMAH